LERAVHKKIGGKKTRTVFERILPALQNAGRVLKITPASHSPFAVVTGILRREKIRSGCPLAGSQGHYFPVYFFTMSRPAFFSDRRCNSAIARFFRARYGHIPAIRTAN
jgi:hypothetical protein